jgi:hypothetical protein
MLGLQRIRGGSGVSFLLGCLSTAMVCFAAPQALATDPALARDPGSKLAKPDATKTLNDLIAKLDAPDLLVRIEAHRELFQNDLVTLPQLTQALGRADLSSEQRTRLNDVGYARFRRAPRAAMGVSYLENPQVERIVIEAPLTNWDSARVLRPGDALVTIDGRAIAKQEDVRISVLSHDPGDQVVVVFERDGVVMRSTIRLGNFADLNETRVVMDRDPYPQAWQLRLERELGVGRAGERAVEIGIKPRELSKADRDLRAAMLTPPRELEMAAATAAPGTIVLMPDRAGEAGEDRTLVAAGTGIELTSQSFVSLDPKRHPPTMRRNRGNGNVGEQPRPNIDRVGAERDQALREQAGRMQAIKDAEQLLLNPKLNREQVSELRQIIKSNQAQLKLLEVRLMALREPGAPVPPPKVP